eukprot:COSAG01_NODE_3839_length_5646_cov_8.715934_1_plen_90_part_00
MRGSHGRSCRNSGLSGCLVGVPRRGAAAGEDADAFTMPSRLMLLPLLAATGAPATSIVQTRAESRDMVRGPGPALAASRPPLRYILSGL